MQDFEIIDSLELHERKALLTEALGIIRPEQARIIKGYFGIDQEPKTIRQLSLNRALTDKETTELLELGLENLMFTIETRLRISYALLLHYRSLSK